MRYIALWPPSLSLIILIEMSSAWMGTVISNYIDWDVISLNEDCHQFFVRPVLLNLCVCSAIKSPGALSNGRNLSPILGNSDSITVGWAWVYLVKTFWGDFASWFCITLVKKWLVRHDFHLWDVIKLVGGETVKGIGIIFQSRTYPGVETSGLTFITD